MRTWAVAIVVTLAMTVSYIDRQTLAALAPTVKLALDIDHTEWGWLTAAFSIAYLVGAPIAGWVVDKVGARGGLIVAVTVWSLAAAAHSLASSFAMLFAMRIVLGIAEAPSFPSAAQCIRRVLPPESRATAVGVLFTGSSIGAMIAGPLAIACKVLFSWRTAFICTAAIGLLYVPLFWAVTQPQSIRAKLATAEDKTPVQLHGLLRSAAVHRAVILVIACAPAIMFVINWLPQLLDTLGIKQDHQGRYLWIAPLAFDVGAVGFGALGSFLDRRSRTGARKIVIAIGGVLTATLALAALTRSPGWTIACCGCAMAGGGALYATLTADMLSRVPSAQASTAGGLTAAAQSIAHVIAAPLVGKVLDRTHSYSSVLIALGLIALPGSLIWILWPMQSSSTPGNDIDGAKAA